MAYFIFYINFGGGHIAMLSWMAKVYGVEIGIHLQKYSAIMTIFASIGMLGIDSMFSFVGYGGTFCVLGLLGVANVLVVISRGFSCYGSEI